MITGHRSVSTLRLPEVVDGKTEQLFRLEVEACMNESRPQIVVDCSAVRRFEKSAVRLLLHALECALKRKGDVRLAGVSPEAGLLLESTGASRLFDVYVTTAEAVDSFQQLPAIATAGYGRPSRIASESAA